MSSQDLVERWIVPDTVRSGPEEARVKGYGVHVWVILDLLKKYQVGKQSAARAYDLPLEAIDAALLYYETYKRDFDAKLALVASDDPMPRSAISGGHVLD